MSVAGRIAHGVEQFIRRPRLWPLLILFWAGVAVLSYAWHVRDLERYAHATAALRGRLVFEVVETMRLWVAQHGGVYAPRTETTPSNTYLETPEKDISSPSGKPLTKINPAYMTRQLGELIARDHDLRIHITSRIPIRPANAPDDWEAAALKDFEEHGEKEKISIVGAGATAMFRYMAPLETKKPCLVCHEKQGYKLGDVRGGISVSFPAGYVFGVIDAQKRDYLVIHVASFLLFALMAWGGLAAIRRQMLALEAARDELVETEKMASLGRMVSGFAHELNTPMGIAVGAISQSREAVAAIGQLLEQDEVGETELRERIDLADETTSLALANLQRAAGMVQSFKRTAFDLASEGERDFDLAEVLDDVCMNLQGLFNNTAIAIGIRCPAGLRLHGPVGALQQVLTNLITNSRLHAFDDGRRAGRIGIAARPAGTRIIIEVTDDGTGMSEDIRRRAFEPFFSTRRGAGSGGLGLYLAYNLVTRTLGGMLSVDSTVGAGSRFVIDLPAKPALGAGAVLPSRRT